MEISLLSKEQLKNNLIIVKVGSESRPSDDYHIKEAQQGISDAIKKMNLDFEPAIIITHHVISIEESKIIEELKQEVEKRNYKPFNRFSIMDI